MSDHDSTLDDSDAEREGWQLLDSVPSRAEATLICGLLESEGVESQIESLLFTQEPVNFGLLGSVRVWVPERELVKARQILADHATAADAEREPDDSVEAESRVRGEET